MEANNLPTYNLLSAAFESLIKAELLTDHSYLSLSFPDAKQFYVSAGPLMLMSSRCPHIVKMSHFRSSSSKLHSTKVGQILQKV